MDAKNRYSCSLVFPIFLILSFNPSKYCYAIYKIVPSQALYQGQTLVSATEIFELGFFSPNNNSANRYVGIWYKQIWPRKVVWVANRENPLAVTDSNASLRIGSNGNLELLDGNNSSIWSTDIRVPSNGLSIAILLDSGNLVLKNASSGEELWQSFQHLSDTLLPGAVMGFNLKTGENYTATSWKNESDPSPGMFVAGLARQRPPQAFVWINGSIPYWRSGPWDKSKFSGLPRMSTFFRSPFNVIEDVEKETTYLYFDWNINSTVANLFLSPDGVLKTILKDNGSSEWYINFAAPKTQCDIYGFCGPFGICKSSKSRICQCLKGFVPKLSQEWSRGDWTGGCVRRNELSLCLENASSVASKEGKKDGFWKIGNVKVPDFYEFVELGLSIGEDSCRMWCFNNCSCLAYSYISGIGCLVWSNSLMDIREFSSGGEDLFLRLAHEELVGRHELKKIIISLVAICSTGTLVAIALGFYKWTSRGKRKEIANRFDSIQTSSNPRDTLQLWKHHNPPELPIFDFSTILIATEHFSPTNKLGQGGFGPVYKGKLQDGKEIAVKRLSSSSGQGTEEFKNEMLLISKLQHRNLVRLYGYCIEKDEKLLVYEFMPNKSSDIYIFDPTKRAQLDWASRFNIINGVAKGLVYLHRDSSLRVIHRDLKASNILLDEKMNPKISDFGLARIFQGTLDLANTKRVVGTLGYMSPEYAMGGIFSEKSDVFSFGVLILEILSGQKNTNFHYSDQHLSLIAYAWQLWSGNKGLDFVDEALAGSYCSPEAIRCINVALLCLQDYAADRPSMPDVVFMLSNETNRPQPKQPIFTFQAFPRFDAQSKNGDKFSMNETTISLIDEGR